MGGRFSDPIRFLYQDQQDNPYFQLGTATADIDLYAYMRELILTANRANVSIYSVDPRGLQGVTDAGQYLDQSEWRTYLQKTQSTLRLMAEATGGFAVVNVNDFPAEFKKIDAETSDYYILGYTSSNPDPQRRVRADRGEGDAARRHRGGAPRLLAEDAGAAAAARADAAADQEALEDGRSARRGALAAAGRPPPPAIP